VQGLIAAFCGSENILIQQTTQRARSSSGCFAEGSKVRLAYQLVFGEHKIPNLTTEGKPLWEHKRSCPTVALWCNESRQFKHPEEVVPDAVFRLSFLWQEHSNRPSNTWPDLQIKMGHRQASTLSSSTEFVDEKHKGTRQPALTPSSPNEYVDENHKPLRRAQVLQMDHSILFGVARGLQTAVPDVICEVNAGQLSILNKEPDGSLQQPEAKAAISGKAKRSKKGVSKPAPKKGPGRTSGQTRKCKSKPAPKKGPGSTAGQEKNKLMVFGFELGSMCKESNVFKKEESIGDCLSNAFTVQSGRTASNNKKKTGKDVKVPASFLIHLHKYLSSGNDTRPVNNPTSSMECCGSCGRPNGSLLYGKACFSLLDVQAGYIMDAVMGNPPGHMPEEAVLFLKSMLRGQQCTLNLVYRTSHWPSGVQGLLSQCVVAVALGSDGKEMVLNPSHMTSVLSNSMLEDAHEHVQKGSCIFHPLMVDGKEVLPQVLQPYQVYVPGQTSDMDVMPLTPRQGQPLSSGLQRLDILALVEKFLIHSGNQVPGSFAHYARLCSLHCVKTLGVKNKKETSPLRSRCLFFFGRYLRMTVILYCRPSAVPGL
jgi:hypothetical protein